MSYVPRLAVWEKRLSVFSPVKVVFAVVAVVDIVAVLAIVDIVAVVVLVSVAANVIVFYF